MSERNLIAEQRQLLIAEGQEILELKDNHAWKLFRARIENTIKGLETSLLTRKLADFDQYLSYWFQRQALLGILGELDGLPAELKRLQDLNDAPVDNSPATGELA